MSDYESDGIEVDVYGDENLEPEDYYYKTPKRKRAPSSQPRSMPKKKTKRAPSSQPRSMQKKASKKRKLLDKEEGFYNIEDDSRGRKPKKSKSKKSKSKTPKKRASSDSSIRTFKLKAFNHESIDSNNYYRGKTLAQAASKIASHW
jgi:hypothetical protein